MRKCNLVAGSVLFFILLVGCATPQKPVAVTEHERQKGVAIEVKSFEFIPNIIKVKGPGTLSLDLKNVASLEHNFTIKSPEGQIIKSVNLPEGKTVAVEIALPRPGKYPFYCDKPLHASFGMKGEIEVAK